MAQVFFTDQVFGGFDFLKARPRIPAEAVVKRTARAVHRKGGVTFLFQTVGEAAGKFFVGRAAQCEPAQTAVGAQFAHFAFDRRADEGKTAAFPNRKTVFLRQQFGKSGVLKFGIGRQPPRFGDDKEDFLRFRLVQMRGGTLLIAQGEEDGIDQAGGNKVGILADGVEHRLTFGVIEVVCAEDIGHRPPVVVTQMAGEIAGCRHNGGADGNVPEVGFGGGFLQHKRHRQHIQQQQPGHYLIRGGGGQDEGDEVDGADEIHKREKLDHHHQPVKQNRQPKCQYAGNFDETPRQGDQQRGGKVVQIDNRAGGGGQQCQNPKHRIGGKQYQQGQQQPFRQEWRQRPLFGEQGVNIHRISFSVETSPLGHLSFGAAGSGFIWEA